ncbi:hypothetical protein Sgly_2288 [Syntrophobotulus glycolicus DSM 8271]|uniref:PEGA domain-containing protein n=1 Tax=Syntrophobotulus glycolicus (strain DSM 8271 / FlGlyR) TaxID=645991 RepID=F0SUC7_SYNGF|nr:PEGA domain-containing protein [Syntrophobotulus glycolicus]ADY56577.1 hypothetical protein Sgly_2288 [Syntrophobotulus glycolicus DSM 8271]
MGRQKIKKITLCLLLFSLTLTLTVFLVLRYPQPVANLNNQDTAQSIPLQIDTDQIHGIPLYIDHKYIGKSPLSTKLPPGKYRITAKPAGYVGSVRYLTLKPEDPADQKIILPVDQHNYQDFLDEITRLGYQPVRVMDYYDHVPLTKKTMVLRHDVDVSAAYALKLAEMEHAKGIKSTFYFRWSTADPQVIKAIRDMGDEVGLHYETLATYALEHNLQSAQEITPSVKEQLRERLKSEIAEFKQKFGDISTVSSHGADENIRLGVSNYQAIMKGQDPSDFGVIGEAYGEVTDHFTYMSDSGGFWEPFPYPQLESDRGPFYFLIHPIHWASSFHFIHPVHVSSSFNKNLPLPR